MPEARSAVFGAAVRRMRELRGWSQTELAQRLADAGHPIGQSRVSTIEAPGPEPRTVSIDQAQAFARVFELPVEMLLTPEVASRVLVLHDLARIVDLADQAAVRAVEHANTVRDHAAGMLKDPWIAEAGYLTPEALQPFELRRKEG